MHRYPIRIGVVGSACRTEYDAGRALVGTTAKITIDEIGRGTTVSFDPSILDNNLSGNGYQNSENLKFGFLGGPLGFNPNANDTYKIDFSLTGGSLAGPLEVDEFVVVGSGAPEPATWAMMILGFLDVGFMGYRRSRSGKFAFRAA